MPGESSIARSGGYNRAKLDPGLSGNRRRCPRPVDCLCVAAALCAVIAASRRKCSTDAVRCDGDGAAGKCHAHACRIDRFIVCGQLRSERISRSLDDRRCNHALDLAQAGRHNPEAALRVDMRLSHRARHAVAAHHSDDDLLGARGSAGALRLAGADLRVPAVRGRCQHGSKPGRRVTCARSAPYRAGDAVSHLLCPESDRDRVHSDGRRDGRSFGRRTSIDSAAR